MISNSSANPQTVPIGTNTQVHATYQTNAVVPQQIVPGEKGIGNPVATTETMGISVQDDTLAVDTQERLLIGARIRDQVKCSLIFNIIAFFLGGCVAFFSFIRGIMLMVSCAKYLCSIPINSNTATYRAQRGFKYLYGIQTASIVFCVLSILDSIVYVVFGSTLLYVSRCSYDYYYGYYCEDEVVQGGMAFVLAIGVLNLLYAIIQIVLCCQLKSMLARLVIPYENPCCCYANSPCSI